MPRVPKKNISLELFDVKPPSSTRPRRTNPARTVYAAAVSKKITSHPSTPSVYSVRSDRAGFTEGSRTNRIKDGDAAISGTRFGQRNQAVARLITKSARATGRIEEIDKPEFVFGQRKKFLKDLPIRPRGRLVRFTSIFLGIAIMATGGFYSLRILTLKSTALSSVKNLYANLEASIDDLKSMSPRDAKERLVAGEQELQRAKAEASEFGLLKAGEWFASLIPGGPDILSGIANLEEFLGAAISLSGDMEALSVYGPSYFISGEGEKLLTLLRSMKEKIDVAERSGNGLVYNLSAVSQSPIGESLKGMPVDDASVYVKQIESTGAILGQLIDLLERPGGFHLLVLFQNPSEMRPSGGFVGSYADVFVRDGAMAYMDVRDIYDPDGWFEHKIIPPKPLQAVTTKWGARDSNWFFDFPTSARKVATFLEISKVYSEQNISFETVIAVNTDVIETLLRFTGPIELPEYELKLDENNFLREVQYEVEAGENKALGKPKQILKDFAPRLIGSLEELPNETKKELIGQLLEHIAKKDIQAYSKNEALEALILERELGGEVYREAVQPGGYLAIASANIAGGKSDVFIHQDVKLSTVIQTNGIVESSLRIARGHHGGNEKDFWHRAPNQSYIQVYTAPYTSLLKTDGSIAKKVYPKINYADAGYSEDADVRANESGFEYGKAVWGAWLKTQPNATDTLEFAYESEEPLKIKPGMRYTFVFDRQSGVRGGVFLEFQAPAGFRWAESGRPVYSISVPNPDRRIALELTLEEI